ncbi:MAG: hypothetical protein K0S18_696, partial [Anaerocolumna sp.]|nr:hypothetical protein [Anaerocolumna sp.]
MSETGAKMKLKYYLRGLGIGILLTTIVLSISYGSDEKNSEKNQNTSSNTKESNAIETEDIALEDL